MIPLALVTGFLGSGKTSFLRHVVEQNRNRKLAYIVNEFAAVDIDSILLDCPPDSLVSIPGGSIFCKCLVSGFIYHLQLIREIPGIEGVVIEASGIADPRVVADMLKETRLDETYRLASVVTIVDPGTFGILLQTLPNIKAQVQAAGIAILNKTDLYDEEALSATESEIRTINPSIEIMPANHAKVDINLLDSPPSEELHGQYAQCADPNYARGILHFSKPVDPGVLRKKIAEIGAYRVKGFLPGPHGSSLRIDATATHFSCIPGQIGEDQAALIMIVPGDREADLPALAKSLGATLADTD